jgi:HPt (histidine-containing phosphotransfer) domain-containing protein
MVYGLHRLDMYMSQNEDISCQDISRQDLSPVHLRYARKLPYKAARLCALVTLSRSAERDPVMLERALREAHQLKGTAAAYGFMGVSQCAERVEAQLGAADWQPLERSLDCLLAAAKAQCERLLATVCPDDTGYAPNFA